MAEAPVADQAPVKLCVAVRTFVLRGVRLVAEPRVAVRAPVGDGVFWQGWRIVKTRRHNTLVDSGRGQPGDVAETRAAWSATPCRPDEEHDPAGGGGHDVKHPQSAQGTKERGAPKRPLAGVRPLVLFGRRALREAPLAERATERPVWIGSAEKRAQ